MIRAVLFDLDGVLVDSRQATIDYFQETFRHFNLPVPPAEAFDELFGLRTIDMLKSLLPDVSDDELASIYEYSRQMSIKRISEIRLVPGARETLEDPKVRYTLGLITSRGKTSVQLLLDIYDLNQYFAIVLDREDITQHKPHPQGLNIALASLHLKPDEAVYVGDAKEDVDSARNARVASVYVSEGPNKFKADYHIVRITELPRLPLLAYIR